MMGDDDYTKELRRRIAIEMACANGAVIEWKRIEYDECSWTRKEQPEFLWSGNDYRIKKEEIDYDDIDYQIGVMQAFKDGAKIEAASRKVPKCWWDSIDPYWDWGRHIYRVAKESPLECWVNVFKSPVAMQTCESKAEAINTRWKGTLIRSAVHMREVEE